MLILRVRNMAGELRKRGTGAIPREQASGYREPDVANFGGIAQESGEAPPVAQLQLSFCAVKDGIAEGDGKADRRVRNRIVVGVWGQPALRVVFVWPTAGSAEKCKMAARMQDRRGASLPALVSRALLAWLWAAGLESPGKEYPTRTARAAKRRLFLARFTCFQQPGEGAGAAMTAGRQPAVELEKNLRRAFA